MGLITRTLLAAAIIGSSAAAFAADAEIVNVPFSFDCKGRHFPEGTYVVTLNDNHTRVHLYNRDVPRASMYWIVNPDDPIAGVDQAKLRFHNVNSQAALSSINIDGYVTPRLDKKPAQNLLASTSSYSSRGR